MNNGEGLGYIRGYFDKVFNNRNINALDDFLDKDYFDDDIGDPDVDHIQNSKEFLTELFRRHPTMVVNVKDAITCDNTISAFLEWSTSENHQQRVIRKGIAIFVLQNQRIRKRHTFIYFEK